MIIKYITTKLQIFINKSLTEIQRNFWPDRIKNNEMWKRQKKPRIDLQIRKRKWGWLGHTLRKTTDDITRQALEWKLQGKPSRWTPKNTWRRTVLEEAKGLKKTWVELSVVRCQEQIAVEESCGCPTFRSEIMGLLIDFFITAHFRINQCQNLFPRSQQNKNYKYCLYIINTAHNLTNYTINNKKLSNNLTRKPFLPNVQNMVSSY